jgi:glycosyltransferase involved in cell wall biosynthesis
VPAPLVSVVVPTHNRVALLPATVHSVLQEREVPLELVVVDDDSQDGTEEWLAQQRDPRLRYLVLRPGRLGSGARNAGFATVEAPYTLFLDDDDLLAPGAIAALLGALERHPEASRAIGACHSMGEGMRGTRLPHPRVPLVRRPWLEELWGWNMPPGVILWRSEVVREIGGWREGLRRAEDTEMNLRAWQHPAALIPRTVLRYRFHLGQMPTAEAWPIDFAAREEFAAGLPEAERARARRALRSRELHQEALEAYLDRDYRTAVHRWRAVLSVTPELRRSPLTGPFLLAFLAKAAAGAALPTGAARLVSSRRRQRRGPVPDGHRRAGALDR